MERKDTKRALRRHHRARLIAQRTDPHNPYWGRSTWTPARIGQVARTPQTCGCWRCCSPRRIFGDLLGERSDLEAIAHEMV